MPKKQSSRRRGSHLASLLVMIALLGACARAAVPARQGTAAPAVPARAEAPLDGAPFAQIDPPAASSAPAPTLFHAAQAEETTEPPLAGEADGACITFTDADPVPAQSAAAAPAEPACTPPAAPGPEDTPEPGPTPTYRYETDAVKIHVTQCNAKNLVYFAVELWLTDPAQLRSAFSSDRFDGAVEAVQDIAERNDAALAINGDFATFNNGGIIVRNGELFRANKSTRQLLVIDKNGDFIPYVTPPEDPKDAAQAFLADGVWQTLVFGPVLVENGEAVPLPKKFFISTGAALEPRTAIGQLGPLHYLILVVDGRLDGYSQGVSLGRLQELFLDYGAQTAFNLDGGGSTTLYLNGNVINRPANGGQRHVPDILYIPK